MASGEAKRGFVTAPPSTCDNPNFTAEVEAILADAHALQDAWKQKSGTGSVTSDEKGNDGPCVPAACDGRGGGASVLDVGTLGYDQYHRVVPRDCPVCEGGKDHWMHGGKAGDDEYIERKVYIMQTPDYDEWRTFLVCRYCGHVTACIQFDPM